MNSKLHCQIITSPKGKRISVDERNSHPNQVAQWQLGTPASWLVDLEAKHSWNITLRHLLWLEVPISHQEQVRKRASKIGPVNI